MTKPPALPPAAAYDAPMTTHTSAGAASSAAATAATSVSGDALFSPLPLPDGASAGGDNNNIIIDGGISSTSEQLQIQRLSSSGRRYTATDALDLA